MEWSDPPTLHALDPHGGQWSRLPPSFHAAARRILGPDREAVEEAVNLSLTAFTAAVEVLSDLMPNMGNVPFGETVRAMRADRERRGRFKADYATKTAQGRSAEFPGAPTMLTDPFCLETNPARYWFDSETCERLVSAFIARQTLNRRRALLDVHESGSAYSLRGLYRTPDDGSPSCELTFVTSEDVYLTENGGTTACRYSVHPVWRHRGSARKLAAVEVIIHSPRTRTLDVDLVTGALHECFEGYRLEPVSGQASEPPYLHEAATRVEVGSEEALRSVSQEMPASLPAEMGLVNAYTFRLVKRATSDPLHQVAMNRAVTSYYQPDHRFATLSGWSGRYERWIRDVAGDVPRLVRTPEAKRTSAPTGQAQIAGEGAFLNAVLAIWLQAQIYVGDLSTDVETYLAANLPQSLRSFGKKATKPTWGDWARSIGPSPGIAPKQMVESWATVWKLLELVLVHHNDGAHRRITFTELVEAMPVRVYPHNFEAEFEGLRSSPSELSEGR